MKNNNHNWYVYVHTGKEKLKRLTNGQAKAFSDGCKNVIS